MTRDQLEHAIRAACDVSKDNEVWVFGSQAILGEYPNPPESICASIEVDIQPKNRPKAVDEIDGSLGERSLFHETHGFYVHGVPITAATLPLSWKDRVVRVQNENGTNGKAGFCIEAHDLAASKLFAYREKDRDFVRTLLQEGLIQGEILKERISALDINEEKHLQMARWLKITLNELQTNSSSNR